jgi:hypothetical protein
MFDPRDERVLQAAEASRRLAQDRAAELARGAALARELPAALDPAGAEAPSRLAGLLSQVEGLTSEGRGAFLAAARPSGAPVVASAAEAGTLLRLRLEQLYPAGSEAREALGAAVGRLRGRTSAGREAQALAGELIARVTGLAAPRTTRPGAELARDRIETARPVSLFEAAHRGQAPPPPASLPPGATPPPSAAPLPRPAAPPPPASALESRAVSRGSAPPVEARALPAAPVRLRAAFANVSDSLQVTTPGLEAVAGRFSKIEASLARARGALGAEAQESARVRYGLRSAAQNLGAIAAHALAAEARLVQEVVPARPLKSVLAGIAEAQGALRAVLPRAAEARAALVDVVGKARYTDVRAALREVDLVARESTRAEAELGFVEGRTAVLAGGAADSGAEPASAAVPGVGLTEDDLRRLGSGLDAAKGAPQLLWTEAAVNAACERGRAQGGVSDAEGQAHLALAQGLLGGAATPVELGAAEIAALLKQAGIALEKVDPQQLEVAARYVATAQTTTDQAEKLRKTLDGFQTLARIGEPRLTRQEMVNDLWAAAKVPGHALQKLSDAELTKALQQVRAALNGGPGEHQLKLGSYNLKLAVGANGTLAASSCKKPGFFARIGSTLKKAVPIALTVMSFIPATAVFARIAQGAISLAKSIRAGSLLGGLTSAASLVAGGAAAFASKTVSIAGTAAKRVASIANGVARSLQGVSSLRQGNVLGGLAAIGSGVADGIGAFAGAAGDGLGRAAARLGELSRNLAHAGQAVSTVEAYRSADRAVSQARAALRQAEATGDRVEIQAARERLARAESAKTSAVLGSAASAASLAADMRASYAKQPGEAVKTPAAKLSLDVALRTAWRGLGVARGIHDLDYAAAGVNALGLAAVGRQVTGSEPAKGLGLTDAANMADAALGYHQASRGEGAANAVVEDAERALRVARNTGDPAAIRHAEANLAEARRAREGALMGGIAAGETLLATAREIGEKLQASHTAADGTPKLDEKAQKEIDRAVATWQEADEAQQRWAAQAVDEKASPESRAAARAGLEALQQAKAAYNRALEAAKGDPARLKAATDVFEGTRREIEAEAARLASRTAPPPTEHAALRPPPQVGVANIERGMTVWEISQRTGVPVERLLEFNAEQGNPLDVRALRVGQQVLVPLGENEVRFTPKTAQEVRAMQQAALRARANSAETEPGGNEGRTAGTRPSEGPAGAAPPVRRHDASADASALHRAMHGGLFGAGTDEAAIYEALEGRSPAEIEAIRASYRDHYGRNLDTDLKGELSGLDLARAENLMRGNRAAADADALHRAMQGVGTDEAAIDRVLQGKSPAERAVIEREYESRYGMALGSALEGELSGDELQRARALGSGEGARADAATLHQAVAGLGTDENAVYRTLAGKSQAERTAIATQYQQMYGRDLATDLRGDLSGAELDRARALLLGQTARADAASMRSAMAGAGTDEKAIEQVLEGKSAPERAAIEAEYRQMYGSDLRTDLASELSGNDLDRTRSLLATGGLSDAEKLYSAVTGLGTDESAIRSVLDGRSNDEIRAISEDYRRRYGRDLVSDLQGDLSGRDEFDAIQALGGRPRTPEEALRRMNERAAYEREGLLNVPGRVLLDLINDEGSRLDENVAHANTQYQQAMADGNFDEAEKARLSQLVGYAQQDVDAYRESKDTAANVVSTVGATAAAVGVVIASGGSGTPVAAAIMNAALAGAGTRVALSGAIEGRGYGWEQGLSDAAQGAVDGGTVAAFAPLGRAAAGAALRGTVETTGQRMAAGAIEGGVEGLAQGAASGGAQGALREGAWDHGVAEGLLSVGQGAATGAGMGAAGGALGGALLGLRARGPAPQPDISPEALAREADQAMKQMVDAGVPPAQARELTENAVREMYPTQARQLYGEAAEFEPALLRRPKGVPDEGIVRAQYRSGASDRLKITDLPEPTRERMRLLADQRLAAIQRRDLLEPLEKAGALTHEQALALTKARAEITEASRLLGETAADAFVAKQFPGLKKVYPPPGAPSRAGDFDQAWVGVDESGNWIVVEAKGGRSELGGRWARSGDYWFEQGSPEYFDEIVASMQKTDAGVEAARALRGAGRDGRVRYLMVRAPVARKPDGLQSLRDIRVREFEMGTGRLERRAGDGVLTTGSRPILRVPASPVHAPGFIYKPRVTADPGLPAGYGATNKYGDIVYSTRGSATDQALALAHERLHSFLSPKLMPLRGLRADLRMTAYQHSQLVRYLEEALAESYAQVKVTGLSGLPTGIRFPIANGYVRLDRVVTEAAVGTLTVGGVAYGVYVAKTSVENER